MSRIEFRKVIQGGVGSIVAGAVLLGTSFSVRAEEYSAKVKFRDGAVLTLRHIALGGDPITAKIGSSSTTITLDKIAAIEIAPQDGYSLPVKLIPRAGGEPLDTTLPGSDSISGTILATGVTYRLTTQWNKCSRVDFHRDTDERQTFKNWDQQRSCSVTSRSGKTRKLANVIIWTVFAANTGYSTMGIAPIKRDEFTQTAFLAFAAPKGVCAFSIADIKEIDFTTCVLTLRNGDALSLLPKDKTASVGDAKLFRAISGSDEDGYWAIDAESIQRIADGTEGQQKSPARKSAERAEPLKSVSILDTKGTKHSLTSVMIESPVNVLGMGRVLTGASPSWTVSGSGSFQSLVACDEYRNQLCVGKDQFWLGIPLSAVKSLAFGKDTVTVSLRDGSSATYDAIEMGTVKGKGAWGDVTLSRSDIKTLEIVEQ